MDQSECLSLSGLLEARGILGLKKNKESRFTKVTTELLLCDDSFNCSVLETLCFAKVKIFK